MTHQDESIYCSPLPNVRRLDDRTDCSAADIAHLVDPGDDPETALVKRQDLAAIYRWMISLPPPLGIVARAVLRGETQASVARGLGVSEAAISKRMRALRAHGRSALAPLAGSSLLA